MVGIGAANAADVNTTQCNRCLENNLTLCENNTEVQNCTNPATDSCFSGAGRYEDTNTSAVLPGFARGCIACPNTTEGCKNFKIFFATLDDWILLDCNIACCKGDFCNNQTVSLPATEPPPPTNGSMSSTTNEPTTAGHPSHYSASTAALAIATIIGVFLF